MNITITRFAIVAAALSASLLLGTPVLNAQNTSATTSGPAAGGPAGTPGGGGAQAFMQQMLERRDANIKVELKVSDDEWSVIKPLLDKVELAQFAFITSGNFGMGGRRPAGGPGGGGGATGGGGGGQGGNPMFQGSPEVQALTDVVQSGSASNDDLKAKMAAVRELRKKATDDLAAARADLQKVLSLRQEAVLLSMGILD